MGCVGWSLKHWRDQDYNCSNKLIEIIDYIPSAFQNNRPWEVFTIVSLKTVVFSTGFAKWSSSYMLDYDKLDSFSENCDGSLF